MATILSESVIVPAEQRVKAHTLTHIPIVPLGSTIADVHALLHREHGFDTVKFVYVVSAEGALAGIVSFRDLFTHSPQTTVDAVMETEHLITVSAHLDNEHATHLALRHGLQSVPVTEHGKLIGVIPSRYLLQIFKKDAAEDVALAAALPEEARRDLDNVFEDSTVTTTLKRLPWLLVGLAGGVLAALIIHGFEDLLQEHLILASFIPLVVYLSGAMSAQVQMFYIRDLAVYDALPMLRYIGRHGIVVVALGIMVATVLFAINSAFLGLGAAATVVSVATMAAVLSAIVTGIGVPFLLSKVLKDPASATPPLAIISSDLLTVFLYFTTASALLS
ncbi:CBS domain-containing protein [Patescibacteria group bacterium]|nr:CBS domain-containing protein [Patescibacteria group bacterium]